MESFTEVQRDKKYHGNLFQKFLKFHAKQTLADAWEITQSNKKHLFWFGFLPSFFSIGVGAIIVYFQAILLKNSSLFTDHDSMSIIEVFRPIWHWVMLPETPTQTVITISVIVFLLAYMLPVFCEGAIILMTKNRDSSNQMGSGFGKGMSVFLPMFEFSLLQQGIRPYSMFLEFLFIARILGKEAIPVLKPIFFVIVVLGTIALFFFSFVSQFIALSKENVGDATISSLKFVARFFSETMKMVLLFIFIELRTLFNVLIIFLIPAILISIGGLIANSLFGIIAQIILGVGLLSFASSISGVLFVYKNVAWTLAFQHLKLIKEREDAE